MLLAYSSMVDRPMGENGLALAQESLRHANVATILLGLRERLRLPEEPSDVAVQSGLTPAVPGRRLGATGVRVPRGLQERARRGGVEGRIVFRRKGEASRRNVIARIFSNESS
jgi:hypothetical protein